MLDALTEREWISSALKALSETFEHRRRGAFCIFSTGDLYVQFAGASNDPDALVCEAASTYSVPWMAEKMTPGKLMLLADLGFSAPGVSRNFWQIVPIRSPDGFRHCITLVQRVFREVFGVWASRDISIQLDVAAGPDAITKLNRGLDTAITVLTSLAIAAAGIVALAVAISH